MDRRLNPDAGWRTPQAISLRTSFLYFTFSCLYILLSDWLLLLFIPSLEAYQQAQTYKGWGFVLVTTLLLFLLLSREERQMIRIYQALEKEREELRHTIGNLEEAYREVKLLAQRCSQIEDVERRRLAGELHDRVGQTLTAINLNLKIVKSLLSEDSARAVHERLQEVQTLIEEAAAQIRDVIAELHPPVVEDFGLAEGLKWLAGRLQKRFDLPLAVSCDEKIGRLPANVEMAFYRVAQSALDNALRHSQATHITLTLRQIADRIEMVVEDNGIGFDPQKILKDKEYPSWGVKIMRERMLAVDGRLEIISEKGKGTRLVASWTKGEAG